MFMYMYWNKTFEILDMTGLIWSHVGNLGCKVYPSSNEVFECSQSTLTPKFHVAQVCTFYITYTKARCCTCSRVPWNCIWCSIDLIYTGHFGDTELHLTCRYNDIKYRFMIRHLKYNVHSMFPLFLENLKSSPKLLSGKFFFKHVTLQILNFISVS